MENKPQQEGEGQALTVMFRIFASFGSVVICFLLYRFGKGAWIQYKRGHGFGGREGRAWNARKDFNYTRLETVPEFYEDEDEGYHESESPTARSSMALDYQKPLPDKPLPQAPRMSPP